MCRLCLAEHAELNTLGMTNTTCRDHRLIKRRAELQSECYSSRFLTIRRKFSLNRLTIPQRPNFEMLLLTFGSPSYYWTKNSDSHFSYECMFWTCLTQHILKISSFERRYIGFFYISWYPQAYRKHPVEGLITSISRGTSPGPSPRVTTGGGRTASTNVWADENSNYHRWKCI